MAVARDYLRALAQDVQLVEELHNDPFAEILRSDIVGLLVIVAGVRLCLSIPAKPPD